MFLNTTNQHKTKPRHESYHQHHLGRRKVKKLTDKEGPATDASANMISFRGKTTAAIVTIRSYSAIIFMAVTLLVLARSLKPATCDNSFTVSSSSSSALSSTLPATNKASEGAKLISVQASQPTRSRRVTRSNKGKDKEQMLSSLAEEIERKHNSLMSGPPKPGINNDRPSHLASYQQQQHYHQPKGGSLSGKGQIRKFDDGMRQIYQMHEQAVALKAVASQSAARPQDDDQLDSKRTSRISIPATKLVSSVMTYVKPKLMGATNSSSNLLSTKRFPVLNDYISTKLAGPSQLLFATKAPQQVSYLLRPPSQVGHQARPTRFPSLSSLVTNRHEEAQYSKLVATTLMEPANSLASSGFKASSSRANNDQSKQSQTISKQKSPKSLSSKSTNQVGSNQSSWFTNPFLQNSLRDLLALSQLPILASKPLPSTAPSIFETGARRLQTSTSLLEQDKLGANQEPGGLLGRLQILEDAYRLVRLLAVRMRNKKDPLLALGSSGTDLVAAASQSAPSAANKQRLVQRSISQLAAWASDNQNQVSRYIQNIKSVLPQAKVAKAKPRGVMWEMATDPSLAVTVFHLIERASVALPLGEF